MPPNKPANSDERRLIRGRADYAQAAAALAQSAQREVALLSHDLPSAFYGTDAFCTAIKDLILRYRRARVRVLVHNPKPAARGHRLVDLGRQLSSFCEFRVLGEANRELRSDWLVIDERHVLDRFAPESLEAVCHRAAPATARSYLRRFDDYWENGQPAIDLRTLNVS